LRNKASALARSLFLACLRIPRGMLNTFDALRLLPAECCILQMKLSMPTGWKLWSQISSSCRKPEHREGIARNVARPTAVRKPSSRVAGDIVAAAGRWSKKSWPGPQRLCSVRNCCTLRARTGPCDFGKKGKLGGVFSFPTTRCSATPRAAVPAARRRPPSSARGAVFFVGRSSVAAAGAGGASSLYPPVAKTASERSFFAFASPKGTCAASQRRNQHASAAPASASERRRRPPWRAPLAGGRRGAFVGGAITQSSAVVMRNRHPDHTPESLFVPSPGIPFDLLSAASGDAVDPIALWNVSTSSMRCRFEPRVAI